MPYAEKLLSLTQITKPLESNHIKEIFESPNLSSSENFNQTHLKKIKSTTLSLRGKRNLSGPKSWGDGPNKQPASHFQGKKSSSQQIMCSGQTAQALRHCLKWQKWYRYHLWKYSYKVWNPCKALSLPLAASAFQFPCTHSLTMNQTVTQFQGSSYLHDLACLNTSLISTAMYHSLTGHVSSFLCDGLHTSWPNSSPACLPYVSPTCHVTRNCILARWLLTSLILLAIFVPSAALPTAEVATRCFTGCMT